MKIIIVNKYYCGSNWSYSFVVYPNLTHLENVQNAWRPYQYMEQLTPNEYEEIENTYPGSIFLFP